MENLVFCQMHEHYEEIYFHADGGEIDFLVKEGMNITKAIQVWYDDVTVTTIPDREIVCFKTSGKGFNQTEFILITNDLDSGINIGQRQVHCIPAAKFLLFNSAMDT